ncbi:MULTISPECIES: glycerophosphodiester phosphodiesterase family protein [Cycloclasticus]|uniref:Glycerophosphoryl diester phosphodiesterase n=1 Tax=Cycloclasticus pugetii TaxID=34068 RepID=A0AB33Z456_9GAMM|nr:MULTISPECIES: glycerophosphodiester phosphodiesterase family protein [Cycloclasticus]ATI03054.1 glycerophosphoryl diester phosphodiesterase [Cycloclasticus sp. PY97N]EPD13808.1 glycerophosphoryl diester phosphodiesterase [Cycloclasticus pugetii]
MLMIGHRGAMGCAPENTLLSIHKAIELGADWVEIDVHCVADKLLVIHDETVDRTTNGRGKLIDYSFEELRALDAGLGQRIPTLQEVLEVTVGKVGLNIELKGLGTGKVLTSLLRNTPETYKNKMLVSSFLMPELEQVVRLNQHVKVGVLAGNNINESIAWATKLKAFSIHIRLQKVTPKWVDRAHDLGLKVYVYTVNKVVQIRRMKELGVDGVFSDYPNRLTS